MASIITRLMFFVIFVQLGFMIASLVEIKDGYYLTTGQIANYDTGFSYPIYEVSILADRITTISNTVSGTKPPYVWQVKVPVISFAGFTVLEYTINIEGGVGQILIITSCLLGVVLSLILVILELLMVLILLVFYSTIGVGVFYATLLTALFGASDPKTVLLIFAISNTLFGIHVILMGLFFLNILRRVFSTTGERGVFPDIDLNDIDA